MLVWVSSTSGHCGSHRCCSSSVIFAGPSHGCPLCDGRNRVKQAVLWSGDPIEPFFLLSAPCPASSDCSLDLGFLLTLPHCLCSCPASATAALGGGDVPSGPAPGCHSGQADSVLALLLPSGVMCIWSHFLFSVFDVAIYWFSRNLEPSSHPHQLLWSPLGGGCSLGTQWAGLKPRVSLCSRRLVVPAFFKPPPFYTPSSL